LKVNF